MSKETYIRGFCKVAAAHRVDPKRLAKYAAYGDVYNAGLASMAMGSPFAPRLYTPGTSDIKPAKEIQQEQARSAVGGALGLAAAQVPRAVRGIRRFLTKEVPGEVRHTHHGTPYTEWIPRWESFIGDPEVVGSMLLSGIPLSASAIAAAGAAEKPVRRLAERMGLAKDSVSAPAQASALTPAKK